MKAIYLGLLISLQAFAAGGIVTDNTTLLQSKEVSLHDNCREGCTQVSSSGNLENVRISEAPGSLVITADLTDFQIVDVRSVEFPDLKKIKLEINAGGWQQALMNGTTNPFEPVQVSGQAILNSEISTTQREVICSLHEDSNRNFNCTLVFDENFRFDPLVFSFDFKK